MHDALGMYLHSLRKIKTYDVVLPFPAHRTTGSVSLNDRIDALLAHHERRLNEASASSSVSRGSMHMR